MCDGPNFPVALSALPRPRHPPSHGVVWLARGPAASLIPPAGSWTRYPLGGAVSGIFSCLGRLPGPRSSLTVGRSEIDCECRYCWASIGVGQRLEAIEVDAAGFGVDVHASVHDAVIARVARRAPGRSANSAGTSNRHADIDVGARPGGDKIDQTRRPVNAGLARRSRGPRPVSR